MSGRDTFKRWAAFGGRWTDWVRPVPFVAMDDTFAKNTVYNFTIPEINYLTEVTADTAVIVDLPGHESVCEGLALARAGFRPIPLYNGTNEQEGAMALVDNHGIASALIWGAEELEQIDIASDAPPAFLLDSNRMHRFKMDPAVFDNSWDIYDQDMPTAEYLLKHGIDKIIVRSEKIQKDLNKILYKYQRKGMTILFTDGYRTPGAVTLRRRRRDRKDDKI